MLWMWGNRTHQEGVLEPPESLSCCPARTGAGSRCTTGASASTTRTYYGSYGTCQWGYMEDIHA